MHITYVKLYVKTSYFLPVTEIGICNNYTYGHLLHFWINFHFLEASRFSATYWNYRDLSLKERIWVISLLPLWFGHLIPPFFSPKSQSKHCPPIYRTLKPFTFLSQLPNLSNFERVQHDWKRTLRFERSSYFPPIKVWVRTCSKVVCNVIRCFMVMMKYSEVW